VVAIRFCLPLSPVLTPPQSHRVKGRCQQKSQRVEKSVEEQGHHEANPY